MKDTFVRFISCALLGLGGLVLSGTLLGTGQATASVDNLFLTLTGFLFTIVGLGYDIWLVRFALAHVQPVANKHAVTAKHAHAVSQSTTSKAA